MFKLKQPCNMCPFLKNSPMELMPGRLDGIKSDLIQGKSFPCHKTVEYDDSDEGDGSVTHESQMCAGAMIFLEKMDKPNQMMRIGARLGDYNRNNLTGFDNVIG